MGTTSVFAWLLMQQWMWEIKLTDVHICVQSQHQRNGAGARLTVEKLRKLLFWKSACGRHSQSALHAVCHERLTYSAYLSENIQLTYNVFQGAGESRGDASIRGLRLDVGWRLCLVVGLWLPGGGGAGAGVSIGVGMSGFTVAAAATGALSVGSGVGVQSIEMLRGFWNLKNRTEGGWRVVGDRRRFTYNTVNMWELLRCGQMYMWHLSILLLL